MRGLIWLLGRELGGELLRGELGGAFFLNAHVVPFFFCFVYTTDKMSSHDTDLASEPCDTTLVMGEFDPAEVAPSALDKLNKPDRDYTHMRHIFASEDQYSMFCMLPGGTDVKQLIIDDYLKQLATTNQK